MHSSLVCSLVNEEVCSGRMEYPLAISSSGNWYRLLMNMAAAIVWYYRRTAYVMFLGTGIYVCDGINIMVCIK